MKQNQVSELSKLPAGNLENIFNVYQEDGGMYFYNLLQTVVFPQNLPANAFNFYTIKHGDTWPFISFKTLNNPNLWWIILLANNLQDPTEKMIPGVTIRIPVLDIVQEVVNQIGRN